MNEVSGGYGWISGCEDLIQVGRPSAQEIVLKAHTMCAYVMAVSVGTHSSLCRLIESFSVFSLKLT